MNDRLADLTREVNQQGKAVARVEQRLDDHVIESGRRFKDIERRFDDFEYDRHSGPGAQSYRPTRRQRMRVEVRRALWPSVVASALVTIAELVRWLVGG